LIIAVAATPKVAIPTLDALMQSEHVLSFVITQPDRPAGRGKTISESDVSVWCRQNNVICHKPESTKETEHFLKSLDVLITIGYGVILPPEILSLPKLGCLNLHFSLLPRWRGAAPVQRAIEAGDAISGVSVFRLDPGMDTGPIYVQKRFALDSDITCDDLLHELALVGPDAVLESLAAMSSGKTPTTQDGTHASRAMKLSKEEGQINWALDAEIIERKIRAFTSNPGAWTIFRNLPMKIDAPEITEIQLSPGEVRYVDKQLLVGTNTFALSIGYLTPSGKARMQASSWANGARLSEPDHFG
jgi:methionyl-tRNA formyltransferase